MSHARAAGLLYLATFVTSIPALALKTPLLDDGTHPGRAAIGGVLEVALALSCVGTALALHPLTRDRTPALSVGFVASRTLEAAVILVGVMAVMSLITLRDAATPAEPADPAVVAALTALHDWSFLLGPAVMASVNALLLGSALLRTPLVPRWLPVLGLAGAPVLLASSVAVLLGAWTQTSLPGALSAVPIALWELGLGLTLTLRPPAAA